MLISYPHGMRSHTAHTHLEPNATRRVSVTILQVGRRNQSRIQCEVGSIEVLSSDTRDFARLGVLQVEQTELQSGVILKRRFASEEDIAKLTKNVRSVATKMTTSVLFAQHQPVNETRRFLYIPR